MIPDWNTYFMTLLDPISSRSKDPNTHLGCVIVGLNNEIRSTGFNSFPRGIKDDVPERLERPEKYMWIEHAERNAIYSAARVGIPIDGCKMFMLALPCMDCARGIIQTGIVEVVYDKVRQSEWVNPKYLPDFERVVGLLEEAKVKLTPWEKL